MDFEFSSRSLADRNEVMNIFQTIFCYTKYLSTLFTLAASSEAVNERASEREKQQQQSSAHNSPSREKKKQEMKSETTKATHTLWDWIN